MDTGNKNQQKDYRITADKDDIGLVHEDPIGKAFSIGKAITTGLAARAAVELGKPVGEAFGKAVGEVVKDWGIGKVADWITDHLFEMDHSKVDHSSVINSTHESIQPPIDAGTPSGGVPQDILNKSFDPHPEHPTGPDGHNMTPYDANHTDPQGHAAHSSSSPDGGKPNVLEHPTDPDAGIPNVLEHPTGPDGYAGSPDDQSIESEGIGPIGMIYGGIAGVITGGIAEGATEAAIEYAADKVIEAGEVAGNVLTGSDPNYGPSTATPDAGVSGGAPADFDPSHHTHDASASYDPGHDASASYGSAHDASASYGSAHNAAASYDPGSAAHDASASYDTSHDASASYDAGGL